MGGNDIEGGRGGREGNILLGSTRDTSTRATSHTNTADTPNDSCFSYCTLIGITHNPFVASIIIL